MMEHTWQTQSHTSFSDEFVSKGAISRESAIEAFQTFDWENEIAGYKKSNDKSTTPKIIFNAGNQCQLIIEATNELGYNLSYSNFASHKLAEIYVSNDFEKNPVTVEELIDLFFEGNIEPELKLSDLVITETANELQNNESTHNNVVFNYSKNHFRFFSPRAFLWLVLALVYARLMYLKTLAIPVFSALVLVLIFLMPVFIHLQYLFKNYAARVMIDKDNHELSFIKGGKEIRFNRSDIFRCQYTIGKHSTLSTTHNYSYVWFILNDGRYICITCFVAKAEELLAAINCKYEIKYRLLPFLPV
ncbi:MAG: hypothetical protein IT236_18460 [Bacteroidia bacterium]|nr:hypothetical protein [Bacteroidia bacterium]